MRISEVLADEFAPMRGYAAKSIVDAAKSLDELLAEIDAAPTMVGEQDETFDPRRLDLNDLLLAKALYEKLGLPFVVSAGPEPSRCACELPGDARELCRRLAADLEADGARCPPYELARIAGAAIKGHRAWCSVVRREVADVDLSVLSLEELRALHRLLAKGLAASS